MSATDHSSDTPTTPAQALLKSPAEQIILLRRSMLLQHLSLFVLIALLLWLGIEAMLLAPTGLSSLTLLVGWFLRSLALLCFIPGLRAGKPRPAVWLSFVLLLYLIIAVLGAFAHGLSGTLSLIEALLIGTLFIVLIRFVNAKRATQNGEL